VTDFASNAVSCGTRVGFRPSLLQAGELSLAIGEKATSNRGNPIGR